MSDRVSSKSRYNNNFHQPTLDNSAPSEMSSSSAENGFMFPFLSTPSGNFKVVPQQVIYESKQLSIVAADPRRTKVNVKSENSIKDMSGMDKMFSVDHCSKASTPKGKPLMEDRDDTPGNMLRRQMEMFTKMPNPTRMFRQHLQAEGDCEEAERMDKMGNRSTPAILPEVSLAKMGFNQETSIDWGKIELPPKTDLHKLLHYRISNYINPDILVKIGNHEYRCHLLVLQCYSGFFVENAVSRIEIDEHNVTKSAFASIYDWMLHLGGDSFTLLRRDNILEIFMASQFLQVKELEEQCWAFIDNEDLFSEDRAFMLYLDARSLGNMAVMELMVPRVQRFFLTFVSSRDFLDLIVEEVAVFLNSNYICIHCELEVFMAAVRWLMFDWEKREKHLVEVMSCVRFGLICPWQLVDIRRNQENPEFIMVTQNPDVSTMIEDGLAYAIIKYWYGKEGGIPQYRHGMDALALTEPEPRNWAGPAKTMEQKQYISYQEFLKDLAKYRKSHLDKVVKSGQGDRINKAAGDDDTCKLPSDMIYVNQQ